MKVISSQDFTKTNLSKNNAFFVEFRKGFFFKCQMMIQLMQRKCAGTDFDTWINISYQITLPLLRVTSFLFPMGTERNTNAIQFSGFAFGQRKPVAVDFLQHINEEQRFHSRVHL